MGSILKAVLVVSSGAALSCGTQQSLDDSEHLQSAALVPCAPARTFGAIPGDGLDDRVALQAALDACLSTEIKLEDGLYNVVTPNPRPAGMYAMLTMRPGTTLSGRNALTTIRFTGDNNRKDWRGIQYASNATVQGIRLESDFVPGSTVEQTHLASIVGPLTGAKFLHNVCSHPQNGSKSGDCLQIVCYPPVNGLPDKRCFDIEFGYNVVERSGRSGIAFHSGLNGTLDPLTGHMTTRFHHNTFNCVSDQDVDGEGTGYTIGVEIDHNVFGYGTTCGNESALAVQLQGAQNVWLHDNVSEGRGFELLGCDQCRLSDNKITQKAVGDGSFPVRLRNVSNNVVFDSETYTRDALAGVGPVITISAKDAAPRDITISNSKLIQHATGTLVTAVGIQGLALNHVQLEYDGTARQADGVNAIGSGQQGCPSGIRADRTKLTDVVANGLFRAVLSTTGSYCGAGSFELQRVASFGSLQGLRCENVTSGAGVLGPVVYLDNALPPPSCAGLVVP